MKDDLVVRCDSVGITLLKQGELVWTAAWSEVEKIIAYQTDDFTIDTRWLQIEAPGGPLRVSEDVKGYGELEAGLERFLNVDPSWMESVARTAFDRNETVVYEREA